VVSLGGSIVLEAPLWLAGKKPAMTTPQEIASYVDRKVQNWPRAHVAVFDGRFRQHPTADELAREFLADTEFEALNLGRFLDTPDGQLMQAGVSLVFPPFVAADTKVIADALVLAAEAQRRGKHRVAAGLTAAAAIVAALLVSDVRKHAA